MIVANLKEATNINEYQTSLKQQLQKAHGEQYTDYLDEISKLTKDVTEYLSESLKLNIKKKNKKIQNIHIYSSLFILFLLWELAYRIFMKL